MNGSCPAALGERPGRGAFFEFDQNLFLNSERGISGIQSSIFALIPLDCPGKTERFPGRWVRRERAGNHYPVD
jgi:hypothetical protein